MPMVLNFKCKCISNEMILLWEGINQDLCQSPPSPTRYTYLSNYFLITQLEHTPGLHNLVCHHINTSFPDTTDPTDCALLSYIALPVFCIYICIWCVCVFKQKVYVCNKDSFYALYNLGERRFA